MKRSFIINVALLILANLLIKPFYLFGIERKLQHIVGNADYGHYYNIFSFTLILQFINDFGIQNYASRLISQNRSEADVLARSLLSVKMVLSVVYFVATFLFASIWYGAQLDLSMVMHLALNQVLISLIFFLRSNISGLGLYKTDAILSILDRFLLIVIMGVLIYSSMFQEWISISSFVWVQSLSLFLCVVSCSLILFYHKYQIKIYSISLLEFKNIIRVCTPFAIIYLTSGFFMRGDGIWIERLLENGNEEAGIYASCFRLYDALSIIALSFSGLLLAMFSNLHIHSERLKELLNLSIKLLYVIALLCGLTGSFYAKEVNQLLNFDSTDYSQRILLFLSLAFIPGSINYILGAYYQACHKEMVLVKQYFFIAIISILLNLVLIPNHKAIGSAIAYLSSQIVLLVVGIYLIRGELKGLFKDKIKIFTFSIALVFLFFIISNYSELNFYLQMLILGISSFVLLILLKILELDQIRKIWSMKLNS